MQVMRSRGLVVAVILMLAVGVGALTTTFAIVRAALWREAPFPDADRLDIVFLQRNPPGESPRRERWLFPRAERLTSLQRSFDLIATYSPASLTLSAPGHTAELIYGERVSVEYLSMLGAVPTSGRLFVEGEDDPARPSAVGIVTERLWRRVFGDTTFTAERAVRLNGVSLAIVGVVPSSFRGLSDRADIWIPRTVSPQITYAEYLTTNQNFIPVIARLRPGIDRKHARAELEQIGAAINRELRSDPKNPEEIATALSVPLREARVDPTAARSLPVLLGSVALLHLLACANVANLLLGRAAGRRQEYAVRLALGSGSVRLFTRVLCEGGVIALAGGTAGVLAARHWIRRAAGKHMEPCLRHRRAFRCSGVRADRPRVRSGARAWVPPCWSRCRPRSLPAAATSRPVCVDQIALLRGARCRCGVRRRRASSLRSKGQSPHCLSSERVCCGTATNKWNARTSASTPTMC